MRRIRYRVWAILDWDEEGWQSLTSDPEVPAIFQEAGLRRSAQVGGVPPAFFSSSFPQWCQAPFLQETDGGPSGTLTLTAGALAIAVVVLTSVQTTFKLGERGEQHRSAAVGFGQLERKLDVFIHRPHPNLAEAWDELLKIADEITNVETGAPVYLKRTYRNARRDALEELESARTKSLFR